jgi:hypothetical protein
MPNPNPLVLPNANQKISNPITPNNNLNKSDYLVFTGCLEGPVGRTDRNKKLYPRLPSSILNNDEHVFGSKSLMCDKITDIIGNKYQTEFAIKRVQEI